MTILSLLNLRSVVLPVAALFLAGCASVPPYNLSAGPKDAAFTAGTPMPDLTAASEEPFGQAQRLIEGAPDTLWWQALQSPTLNALVDEALRASPTLVSAEAVQRQASELHAAQAGATRLPQVDLGLGAQRQQISPSSQGLPGDVREFGIYNAALGVRYRFDFGDGSNSTLRALAARVDVRRHELHAARHALAGNIATAAITRARLAGQIEAQSDLLRIQQELIRLAEVRTRLGQAGPDEVDALTAQAEQTRSGLALLRKQMHQAEHQLAVLAGRAPSQGVYAFTLADFQLPRQLPVTVPSEWARRRPDILAAEATVRAAHAEMGAAYARQYPQLNLSASLGSQALTTSALFGGPAAVWSVASQLTQPLFNAGLPAERRAAQAALDAASANYQRVVLEALRSVADALRAVEHDADALAALSNSVRASQAQYHVVERQYRAGIASLVQLTLAQQQLSQARIGLVIAQSQRLLDTVALAASLAGDSLVDSTSSSLSPQTARTAAGIWPDREPANKYRYRALRPH